MYCAVHSPMPGRARSAASVASMSAPGRSESDPSAMADASARMVRAREAMMPSRAISSKVWPAI